jgi:hypothetical protein
MMDGEDKTAVKSNVLRIIAVGTANALLDMMVF